MGMAASQARYLGLTARKTNIEYEGQQINQARTALANQSANLFNQMLTMEVPTAPSTTDYTTVQYSYKDGVYGETIDEMYELSDQQDGYNWLVTHHHFSDIYTGIKEMLTNPQVLGPISTPHTTTRTTAATTDVVLNNVHPGISQALTTGLTRTSDGWGGYTYTVAGFNGGATLTQYAYGTTPATDAEIDAIYDAMVPPMTHPTNVTVFLSGTSPNAQGNAYFLQTELNGKATTPYTYQGGTGPNDAIIEQLFDTPLTTAGAYSVYTDGDGILQVFKTAELANAAGQVGESYTQHW